MLNQQVLLEIMERLHLDAETEMTRDELERILNEELAKPEEQMDAELIQDIVQLLEDGVTAQEQENAWKATARQLPGKRMHPAVKWAVRIAATLVIAMGLSVLTYRTAEAFNWQLILRLMRPFAETFMLYSGEQPGTTTTPVETYGDGVKADESGQYAAIEESPEFLLGYPVRPCGVPERFAYLQGSSYCDDTITMITHVFSSDGGVCIFSVTVMNHEEQTASHQFERTVEETQDVYLAGCRVTYYFNSDDATVSAYWTLDNARYSIFGVIDEAELALIVESTMSK